MVVNEGGEQSSENTRNLFLVVKINIFLVIELHLDGSE
jgi:hypothetical protein